MIRELFSEGPWLLLFVQATICLAVGLGASYALRHRPARAHQILLTAVLTSVLMPGLYLSAKHFGLGVLASKPVAPSNPPALGEVLSPAESGWVTGLRLPVAEIVPEPTLPVAEPIRVIRTSLVETRRVPWKMVMVVCWSVATVTLSLLLVLRFLLGWRVVRTAQPWDSEPTLRALATARSRLGVSQSIRIRRSGSVHSPVIWCWRREPVLLVQENASRAEPRADWTGVFCHEVSHWRRRDHVTGMVTEVLTAALPWHPLLWWAKDRLLRLSEQACGSEARVSHDQGRCQDREEGAGRTAARRQRPRRQSPVRSRDERPPRSDKGIARADAADAGTTRASRGTRPEGQTRQVSRRGQGRPNGSGRTAPEPTTL